MLARLRAVLALGLLALGLPLSAQLDPRLQAKTPDFLDLFTGGSSSGGGAQVFFVLEASGAMNRLMFHRGYPNEIMADAKGTDQSDEEMPKDAAGYAARKDQSRYVSLAIRAGAHGLKFVRLVDGYTGSWPTEAAFEGISGAVSISGQSYIFGGEPVDAAGKVVAYGQAVGNILVRPDPANLPAGGVRVEAADVQAHPTDASLAGAANGAQDARNWVRSSTHVRMACWKVVGGRKDEASIRFVDLPLNWTVFDWAPDGGGFRTWNGKGLPPRRTVGSVEVDGTYPGTPWGTGKELNFPMTLLYNPWECPRWSYHDKKTTELVHLGATIRTETGTEEKTPWIGTYRTRYLEWIFWAQDDAGNYLIPDAVKPGVYRDPDNFERSTLHGTRACFSNGLPFHSRLQAMKEAMLTVIEENGTRHRIGYRFLGGTDHDFSSNAAFKVTNPELTGVGPIVVSKQNMDVEYFALAKGGGDRKTHMTFLSRVGAYNDARDQGHTLRPLHRAYYSALMQYQSLLFGEKVDTRCGGRYLVVLGTGNFNDPKEYKPTEVPGSLVYLEKGVAEGNKLFEIGQHLKHLTHGGGAADALGIASGQYWNMPNLAGLAAHGGKSKELLRIFQSGESIKDGGYLRYLPFQGQLAKGGPAGQVPAKASEWFPTDSLAPIHTMTVGLGLPQVYDVPDNLKRDFPRRWGVKPIGMGRQQAVGTPKWRMMATAACGNPRSSSAVLTDSTKSYDPADPNSIHYFDGADPAGLVQAFRDLMDSIGVLTGKGSVAAPTLPVAGMGLGQQMYLTKFEIPEGNGTTWKGDLMMFPTREENGRTLMLQVDGTGAPSPLAGPAEPEKAQWAASDLLRLKPWKDRKVYTRLPGAKGWMPIEVDSATGQPKEATFNALKGVVGTGAILKTEGDRSTQLAALANEATKKDLLLWLLGKGAGDTNRDNLMGDVINSTPAVAEYHIPSVLADLPQRLKAKYGEVSAKNPRFRVIFVGTNHGQLHAFGELSWEEPYVTEWQKDPQDASKGTYKVTRKLVQGVAEELWAFVPTDFLTRLHYLTDQKQALPHRYLVDGTPVVYHLDLPASGMRAGNGKIDSDSVDERARLIFGLGRGGRSCYALDIKDPFAPDLAWSLVADERGEDAVRRLGATTATPALGRLQVGTGLKDVVFLGGGYSHPLVDQAFSMVLGRSLLAVDVQSGSLLRTFTIPDSEGPVVAQAVPLDFYMNSGLVQRVYFADHQGSLWSVGANKKQTDGPFKDWRLDSSQLDDWSGTPRKVFHGAGAGAPTQPGERILSTAPSVFSISSFFPVAKVTVGSASVPRIPATVGITFTSGDRFNPKDLEYALAAKPAQNHLHVVFDRNDVWEPITPKDLYTADTLAPSYWATRNPTDFYTEHKGYRLKLNARGSANFAPKGLVEPLVLAGTLFFSDFRELATGAGADGCGSLNAESMTARVCDVMRPVFPGMSALAGSEKVLGCASGRIALWYGVSSRLAAKGVVSGLQAGLDKAQDKVGQAAPAGDLGVKTLEGNLKERFARPRVWRTVQDSR